MVQLQPQEISPPPTANLDRSNDKVYENVTGLVKAVIEMSNRIQPAAPEEYVPMVKVGSIMPGRYSISVAHFNTEQVQYPPSTDFKVHINWLVQRINVCVCVCLVGGGSGTEDSACDSGRDTSCSARQHTQRGEHTDAHSSAL